MNRERLKRIAMDMNATLQVGKFGLNDRVKTELDNQLEANELIKVKFLQSAGPSSEWKDDFISMVGELGATLVEIKGKTAVVYRKKKDH